MTELTSSMSLENCSSSKLPRGSLLKEQEIELALIFSATVEFLLQSKANIRGYEKRLRFVEQPVAPTPDPKTGDPEMIDRYYESVNVEQEVACLILSCMSPDQQRTLEKFNAYDMLKELKTMFEEQAKQELFEIVKAFHACKQEDGQSVSSYLLKMKSYLDTLECLGFAMLKELGVSLIFNSFNKDYDQFIQNYNMHSMGKMIVELHAMLKLHEKGIPKKAETPVVLTIREHRIQKDKKKLQGAKGKDKGKNRLVYGPKPKILPLPKRDNLEKNSIFHHYKEVGYWRKNSPSYHAELKKRKNAGEASTSGIFTIELYAFPNKSWVYDTGHIYNTFLTLQKASRIHGLLNTSGSDVGFELIQENDTQPSKSTSKRQDEVEPAKVEPHSVEVHICSSGRIFKHLIDMLDAMNTEMQSMKDNQVWCLVDVPLSGLTVRSKWLFKKKIDMDGNVHIFKARLVEKGYTQIYDIDYGETFPLVTNIRAIKILLAITPFYDYEIWKMDVKTAFLNGHLSEDVHMVQLEGFVDPNHPSKVCKL
ncbi:zinc finger, CCHC-type containing protein [Tanacetum coccineum]